MFDKTDPNPLCNKDFEATMNPANCNEFFVCLNSVPVRFKCPADLAFSEVIFSILFLNHVVARTWRCAGYSVFI